MIKEIYRIKAIERRLYLPYANSVREKIRAMFLCREEYEIYRFMCALRLCEYWGSVHRGFYSKFFSLLYLRKIGILSEKLNFYISPGSLGQNVILSHKGIIINGMARIGNGCILHGDNCIGIKNTGEKGCPVIGKNVDIGVGAKILGDIYIADNVVIGANAVVTKSVPIQGSVVVGIPARVING